MIDEEDGQYAIEEEIGRLEGTLEAAEEEVAELRAETKRQQARIHWLRRAYQKTHAQRSLYLGLLQAAAAENSLLQEILRLTIAVDPESPEDGFTFLWPKFSNEQRALVREIIAGADVSDDWQPPHASEHFGPTAVAECYICHLETLNHRLAAESERLARHRRERNAEIGRLRAERDEAIEQIEWIGGTLKAENERLRAVVEAAIGIIERAQFKGEACDVCTETYRALGDESIAPEPEVDGSGEAT